MVIFNLTDCFTTHDTPNVNAQKKCIDEKKNQLLTSFGKNSEEMFS